MIRWSLGFVIASNPPYTGVHITVIQQAAAPTRFINWFDWSSIPIYYSPTLCEFLHYMASYWQSFAVGKRNFIY